MAVWKKKSPYGFPAWCWMALEHGPGRHLIAQGSEDQMRRMQRRWQLFRYCLREWTAQTLELDQRFERRLFVVREAEGWALYLQVGETVSLLYKRERDLPIEIDSPGPIPYD